MVEASITYFDLGVYIILGLSTLIAFLRGFLKEILSLGTWVGASVITLYYSPDAIEYMKQYIEQPTAQYILGVLMVFFGSFIVIATINRLLLRYAKKTTEVGVFDNILGAIFGFLRGAFVVSLAYLIFSYLYTEETMPEFIKNSLTQEYTKKGARLLVRIAPDHLIEESMQNREGIQDTVQDIEQGVEHAIELQQDEGLENLDDSDIINYLKDTKEKLDNPQQQNINSTGAVEEGISPESAEDLKRIIESFDFENNAQEAPTDSTTQ